MATKDHLPLTFFLVGAARAGTTALYGFLQHHPDVFMSPIKEPNFFATDIDTTRFRTDFRTFNDPDIEDYLAGPRPFQPQAQVQDESQYRRLFDGAAATAVGEASVSYLWSRTAAQQIATRVPDARIVMILRDPVDRAFSHWLLDRQSGFTNLGFRDAIEADRNAPDPGWGVTSLYLELGRYAAQAERFQAVFPADHIRVYLYDDFVEGPQALVRDLYHFLGVGDPAQWPDLRRSPPVRRVPRLSSPAARRWGGLLPAPIKDRLRGLTHHATVPELSPEDRLALLPDFADDVKRLAELIDRDLSAWLAPIAGRR